MRIRNALSLTGGLAVLCIAGYYWGGISQKTALTTNDASHLPDYQISRLSGIQVNEQGLPERTFKADTLSHYNEQDLSIIKQPVIILYQQQQAAWQLTAQQASLSKDNTIVALQHEVLAKQLNRPLPLQFSTQSLTANQQTQTLQTDSPVTVSTPQGQISSLALQADMQQGTVQFIGQVRGTYVLSPR